MPANMRASVPARAPADSRYGDRQRSESEPTAPAHGAPEDGRHRAARA